MRRVIGLAIERDGVRVQLSVLVREHEIAAQTLEHPVGSTPSEFFDHFQPRAAAEALQQVQRAVERFAEIAQGTLVELQAEKSSIVRAGYRALSRDRKGGIR